MTSTGLKIECIDQEMFAWGGIALLKQSIDKTGITRALSMLTLTRLHARKKCGCPESPGQAIRCIIAMKLCLAMQRLPAGQSAWMRFDARIEMAEVMYSSHDFPTAGR
jgi:hypothetical protein